MQKNPASRKKSAQSVIPHWKKMMQKKPSMGKRNTTMASADNAAGSSRVNPARRTWCGSEGCAALDCGSEGCSGMPARLKDELAQAFVYVEDNCWQLALGIVVSQGKEQSSPLSTATVPDGLQISGTLAQLDLSSPLWTTVADLHKDKVMYVQIVDTFADHPSPQKLIILARMTTMMNILALMMRYTYPAQPLLSTYAICDISQSINYSTLRADGRVQLLPAQLPSYVRHTGHVWSSQLARAMLPNAFSPDSAAIWSFWDECALTGPQLACVLSGMRAVALVHAMRSAGRISELLVTDERISMRMAQRDAHADADPRAHAVSRSAC
jgi:hypothetical protein